MLKGVNETQQEFDFSSDIKRGCDKIKVNL